MASIHDFTMPSIEGEDVPLRSYDGKVCLVVNLASQCGLTPQYAGLRGLHDDHQARGFAVLGFPCNQFGAQEPGSDAEILEFARSKYDASFPIFSKVEVNGDGGCPLYAYLKAAAPDEEGNTEIPWNFTKFLVGRDGRVIKRYGPQVTPEEIAAELGEHL